MGWQDDPVVEESTASQPAWQADPEVSDGAEPQAQAPQEPSMGEVVRNSLPKAAAGALQNAYDMAAHSVMGQIIKHGVAALTGNKNVVVGPDMQARAAQAGLVDPSMDARMSGPQKVVDAMIQGAVAATVVPGPGIAGTAKAMGMGALSGFVGKTTENLAKGVVSDTAAHWLGVATGAIVPLAPLAAPTFRAVKPAPQSPLNTKTRMETLRQGQELGLVVQPTSVRPSVANQTRESIAGPGKLNIEASLKNQRAGTEAAKQELGLPPQAELDSATFAALKKAASGPYREVEQLSGGKNLLEQVQQKRADAAAFWRANGNTPSPEIRKAAMQAEQEAHQFEVAIDQLAQQSGVPGLVNRVRGARQAFAKIYDVETATNVGDGHVSLPVLGRMLDAGRPLSGRLEVMGKFWNAFKPVTREGSGLGTAASGTDAASAALLATTGASGSGSLLGTLAGAAPGLRGWARNKSLSPSVQKKLLEMGGREALVQLRPAAARGLSRAALIGQALSNTEQGGE